jgi:hypothetical protein
MPESAKLVTDFFEIASRPDFDSVSALSSENFDGLVWEYRLPDDVLCQVQKPWGLCKHKHRNGWLGRIKSGRTVLIGSDCVQGYFEGDKSFTLERRRFEAERALNEALIRINTLLADRDGVLQRIKGLAARLQAYSAALKNLEERLPETVVNHLKQATRTGNNRAIIELRYVERDEHDKEVVTWVEQQYANLQGLPVWSSVGLKDLVKSLKAAKEAVTAAELKSSAGIKKIKAWLKDIDELAGVESRIENIESYLNVFTTQENLLNLIFLCRSESKQLQCATAILALTESGTPQKQAALKLRNQLYLQIKQHNNGRDFRGIVH